MDVKSIYRLRFDDQEFRRKMWKVLCSDVFQRFVPPGGTVLEVACGYCEFINSIEAGRKLGIDINTDSLEHAASDVNVFLAPSTDMSPIKDDSVDLVFMSNFLEHIDREQISDTMRESLRVLRPGGRVVILQPNIRFSYQDYWMFFDHITAIDDRAVVELLRSLGFHPVDSKPRFLPYSTKGKLPNSIFLLRLYLRLKFLHPIFGKQSLIVGTKPGLQSLDGASSSDGGDRQ
jgi:SAM-dependent methyltransferase